MTAHSRENSKKGPKRMRSATAPVIRAGVMAANMHWNMAKARCGMVGA